MVELSRLAMFLLVSHFLSNYSHTHSGELAKAGVLVVLFLKEFEHFLYLYATQDMLSNYW